jgi:hypothetical protein
MQQLRETEAGRHAQTIGGQGQDGAVVAIDQLLEVVQEGQKAFR